MLFTKIIIWAFATAVTATLTVKEIATKFSIPEANINELLSASDVSTISVEKWADFLHTSSKEIRSWTQSAKTAALEEIKVEFKTYMENDTDTKLVKRTDAHEADHRRRLAGCPSARCGVCAAGLTIAYVTALTACGAAALTEEAISAGTLTPVAVVQLGACVGLAHGTYIGGWTFCLGMKD
ncbi:hypothetical protein FVEG_00062 [Fusarium verticillioides 7600]|uniref:Multiprotein-bridging factor 1 n=1 Tax=Gibberella moniliformis (strain M3125 / FGSC 7600) TaxID=334819 RepID=W7LB15_GIBM7|nr:hypothetical protein FVEG_00062 [Fusarium verticillioides 7600]EWG35861.1 hypothetical protein FVEG_00062 [Fusarium verticillioides 7600]